MSSTRPKKLSLPASLLKEIGEDSQADSRRLKAKSPRKDRRKAERHQKRARQRSSTKDRSGQPHRRNQLHVDEVGEEERLGDLDDEEPAKQSWARDRENGGTKREHDPEDEGGEFEGFSSDEDRPRQPRISRTVQDRLAQDDAEIAELERKLGLKKRKSLPKSFQEDGLADLLGNPSDGSDNEALEKKKRKAEADEWLANKRQKALSSTKSSLGDSQDEGIFDEDHGLSSNEEDDDKFDEINSDTIDEDEDEDEDGDSIFESDEGDGKLSDTVAIPGEDDAPRIRENPYVAPTSGRVAKYIPPSLRQKPTSDSEINNRVKSQVRGLLNKVTESNMISILGDVEKLYREYPRQPVTSNLVDIMLDGVCNEMTMIETLLLLPAGFAAAVYKVIGMDFGGHLVERVVQIFKEHYDRAREVADSALASTTKEATNLMTFLSGLYNFQVVSCNLVFDYIRWLLSDLTELHAELLLKLILISGPQLRRDDPMALKDIVSMIRPAISRSGGKSIPVRAKFMIETIIDLKDNKRKEGRSTSAMVSEYLVRMKKTLGTLNSRKLKATEPLGVSLKDVEDAPKGGKWWLVGASWEGKQEAGDKANQPGKELTKSRQERKAPDDDSDEDGGVPDIHDLARALGMNTEVRMSIFIAVASAIDYDDAYRRILKLRLNKNNRKEISNVLIECVGSEEHYNPYYTLVARRLCPDHQVKWAFQASLWNIFKRIGESVFDDGGDEEDDGTIDLPRLVNIAKMYGSLGASGSLPLSFLKCLNFTYLQAKTRCFVEVMLVTLILECQKKENRGSRRKDDQVELVFRQVADDAGVAHGLKYFLKKVVRKSDLVTGPDAERLRRGYKMAVDVLETVEVVAT